MAGLNTFGSLTGYGLAYLFFYYSPKFVCHTLELTVENHWFILIGIVVVLLLTTSSLKTRRDQREALGHEDSIDGKLLNAMHSDPTVGSVVVDHYASRVTAPAFALSQIFQAGPNCLFAITDRLKQVIDSSPMHENKLRTTFDQIVSKEKWHSATDYLPEVWRLVELHRLDLIELDLRKGRLKENKALNN